MNPSHCLHPDAFSCLDLQVQEVQAPAQVKKAKNKPKADQVKPVQFIITDDGKEPDEGKRSFSFNSISDKAITADFGCEETQPVG